MNSKKKSFGQIINFMNPKIEYNMQLGTYFINEIPICEISPSFLNNRFQELEDNLLSQLKDEKQAKEMIILLIKTISPNYKKLITALNQDAITFLNSIKTTKSNYQVHISAYKKDRYKTYKSNNIKGISKYLNSYKHKLNDYKTSEDFNKGILLYILKIYCEKVDELVKLIISLYSYSGHIDFNINKEKDTNLSESPKNSNIICHANCTKLQLAYIMKPLVEKGYVFFDKHNPKNNLIMLHKFIEQNFTFKDFRGEQRAIKLSTVNMLKLILCKEPS